MKNESLEDDVTSQDKCIMLYGRRKKEGITSSHKNFYFVEIFNYLFIYLLIFDGPIKMAHCKPKEKKTYESPHLLMEFTKFRA